MMRRRALCELGDAGARTSPMQDNWQDNLHPALVASAEALVANGLVLHDHARALNSSQCFAMNLFLPFVVGDTGGLAAFLSEHIGRAVRVRGVDLEYYGSGHILGEVAGADPTEDEGMTMADVALHLEDNEGRTGLAIIEVKLSERGFSKCGGRHSRGNRDDAACRSRELLFESPHRCYLHRPYRAVRDRRYWQIFQHAHADLSAAFPGATAQGCPFSGDWQQPMRNHALCLGHTQAGLASFWLLALVHHDDNPDVTQPWDDYRDATADAGHLFRWPASNLMGVISSALPHSEPPVAPWLRDRYLLGAST